MIERMHMAGGDTTSTNDAGDNRDEASAVDRLRHRIITGELAPGERLVELQLSDELGMGRATIRSAIAELAKEGLVERTLNRGATVRRVSLAEAIQITQARQALESLCAAHAALNATENEADELRQIMVDMRVAAAEGRSSGYSRINRILHRRLCEISGHHVAAELVVNLRNRAANHQFQLALRTGRMDVSLPQHEAIVAAVVTGNAVDASAAMHGHLESVIEMLREWSDYEALA